ncbi:ATP-binding cassette domain-containing protein [Spongiivirga sp. MCCC 1A20706]|uniref:ABC transporter ATP-binding protein n=1 Tax=Spongiivirga sp. MCCC 1A20706 TaxID=3160963 RepID=UPI003977CED7
MHTPSSEHLLVANNITKKYGDYTALNKVSISVPRGSIFGLLGPNGAGKTSLIRIINQITLPDEGSLFLNGEHSRPEHVRQIGYLPEERGLYKNMKVGEQAIYLARLKGLSKSKAKAQLKYWFDRLHIDHWWNKKLNELSKGMAQKIQFVVTVLHNPKLLIFDEPFSGFDPVNANQIKDEILQLRDDGATVIFSTHRMESVEELCDHIALIDKSEKILDGKLIDIKREYRSNTFEVALETANNKGLLNQIQKDFKISDAHFRTIGDELKLNIHLDKDKTANYLVQYLNNKGTLTHFVEKVPSVNDIFVQSVSKENNE